MYGKEPLRNVIREHAAERASDIADAVIGEMRAGLPKLDAGETHSILYGERQMARR